MKHTEGKWIVDERNGELFIESIIPDGDETRAECICKMNGNEPIDKADAQRIVTAVNSHDELVEAFREFLIVINRSPIAALHHYGGAIVKAETALAKATQS